MPQWVWKVILKSGTRETAYYAVAPAGQSETAIKKIRAIRESLGFRNEPLVRCKPLVLLDAP